MLDILEAFNKLPKGYEMTEQAFIDCWEEFGKPSEIIKEEEIERFLSRLFENTKGQFIVDHFFNGDYDYVHKIKKIGKYFYFYWKNFENRNLEDELTQMEIASFGGFIYKYSVIQIKKIKIELINNHLNVMIMPIVSKLIQVEKHLGIRDYDSNNKHIIENDRELITDIRFIREGKTHQCYLYHLPFYSILLQPKENVHDRYWSHGLLLDGTFRNLLEMCEKNRLELRKLSPSNEYEIRMRANLLRTLLENGFKYYYILRYGKLNEHYERNYCEKIYKNLNIKKDPIVSKISEEDINFINKASHDDGDIIQLDKIIEINQKINSLIQFSIIEIINNDEYMSEDVRKVMLDIFRKNIIY